MAIRIPPLKTPTDGTLLTSARNVADEWYQPLPPKQGPQWRLWANLPAVELWQAITLSCDIEPKYYLGDADPEFQLRMRIAIGNGLGKGDRPHCALVTLTDVARLARRCGWTLPPEFPKPVAEQPRSAGAKPLPEEVKRSGDEMAATPAVEQPTCAEAQPIPSGDLIPGKLPRVAAGRLAVKAAWEIELETKRAATVPEVMRRLQYWADEGKEPEYLILSDRKKKCVVWNAGRKEKDYDEEACGKAIERWKISRR